MHSQPRVIHELLSSGPVLRVPLDASFKEASQEQGLGILDAVLLNEDLMQSPLLQLLDALKLTILVIEIAGAFALAQEAFILALANQFGD